MTCEEEFLWSHLRKKQLGVKFRRQHSIGEYIADFYAPELKLVIEIDGAQHCTEDGLEYDKIREEYMAGLGIETLRISNEEIRSDILGVVDRVKDRIK